MASFGLGRTQTEGLSPEAEVDSSTPWMAASEGNLSLLQASLKALTLTATATDENGYTLLHAAAAYGQLPVMEWLLSQGVPVDAVDNDGDSPLHHVEEINAAKMLIERGGANAVPVNAAGKTPLQVKQDDLDDLMEDEDDNDDAAKLRELIGYLTSVTGNQ